MIVVVVVVMMMMMIEKTISEEKLLSFFSHAECKCAYTFFVFLLPLHSALPFWWHFFPMLSNLTFPSIFNLMIHYFICYYYFAWLCVEIHCTLFELYLSHNHTRNALSLLLFLSVSISGTFLLLLFLLSASTTAKHLKQAKTLFLLISAYYELFSLFFQ